MFSGDVNAFRAFKDDRLDISAPFSSAARSGGFTAAIDRFEGRYLFSSPPEWKLFYVIVYVKYFFDKLFSKVHKMFTLCIFVCLFVCMYVCMYQYYLYSYLVLRPRDFRRSQSLKDPIVHPIGPSTAIYGSSRRADALENTCSSFQCDG